MIKAFGRKTRCIAFGLFLDIALDVILRIAAINLHLLTSLENMLKTDIVKKPIVKLFRDKGFTLLELIAVMALLALLASLSVPRFIDLTATASQKALKSAVEELNTQEKMVWLDIMNSESMWIGDESVFSRIETDLGAGYHWSPKANIDGGKLHFKDQMVKLKRIPSTATSAGKWRIIFSSNR